MLSTFIMSDDDDVFSGPKDWLQMLADLLLDDDDDGDDLNDERRNQILRRLTGALLQDGARLETLEG